MTEETMTSTVEVENKFALYRRQSQESIRCLWDEELNFAQNISKLLGTFTLLPNASLQLPILTSAIITPTPMCDILPVVFCIGGSGSGKSTIGMVASEIHSSPILNSSSSPMSIRNECNRLRFGEDGEERIYMLIWDDIKASTFLDSPTIYSIFRGGYNRSTDTVTVAGQDGTNFIYRVFGARLVSSIEPVFNHPRMAELQRRTIPIVCKKFGNFTQEEQLESGVTLGFSIGDKPDPSDYDWNGVKTEMIAFWNDDDRLLRFAQTKAKLKRSKKLKDKLGDFFILGRDLISTAVAAELFDSLDDAVEAFATYWNAIALPQFSDLSAMAQVIQGFLDDALEPIKKMNMNAGYEVMPYTVSPRQLKARIALASQNGELDQNATPQEIASTMRQLGWELQDLKPPSPITGMHWVKTSR